MAWKVNVGTKLTGELEGLNLALQHGVAPVEDHPAEIHRSLGYAGPEGAVVVERVGELDPAVLLQVVQSIPEFIHICRLPNIRSNGCRRMDRPFRGGY